MHPSIRILIVEDHTGLATNLFEFFDSDQYVLDFAPDGLTALHLVATNTYDVIILDVMLPGLSGFEVCRRIRNDLNCSVPIIFMTAKDQLQDKESGYGVGADDYLVKPFDLRELQLRVLALFRRKAGYSHTAEMHAPGISFNPETFMVSTDSGENLELSGTAAQIFGELIRAYPGHLSYAHIKDVVWGEKEADINTIRTHVYMLRKTLDDGFGYSMIKTVHGRGYQLICPVHHGH